MMMVMMRMARHFWFPLSTGQMVAWIVSVRGVIQPIPRPMRAEAR
jgi:hypothetical protein